MKEEQNEKFKHSEEYLEEKINSKLIKENKKIVECLKEIIDKAVKVALSHSEVNKDQQTKQKNSNDHTDICEPIKKKNKVKAKKITKEDKEKEVILEFKKDSNDIFETRINCGLKLDEIKCKQCDFDTFSEGLIRMHKRSVHQLKESNQM